jgi:hypothetical protein
MKTVLIYLLIVNGAPTEAYYNVDRCTVHAYQYSDAGVPAYCVPIPIVGSAK